MWAALRRHPGATAAELAAEAPGSRSAVGKLLAAWAADGSATSTAGPKPRDARRWTAAPITHDTAPTGPSTGPQAELEDSNSAPSAAHPDTVDTAANADGGEDHAPATARDGIDHAADPVDAPAETDDPVHTSHTPSAATSRWNARGPEVDAAVPDRPGAGGVDGLDAGIAGADVETPGTSGAVLAAEPARGRELSRARAAGRNRSGSIRLPKGGLRGQVEDYLADTPGEHSPIQIGKVLGRSSGAIANALESLVGSGGAVRTWERPRRYSHPDHADAIDQTDRHAARDRAAADRGGTRPRGAGRGVCGVGTYVTVLAVLPLDSVDAISTDEIADWVRTRVPGRVLFAAAAHGVTRAALSAGAEPAAWPTTATDTTEGDVAPGLHASRPASPDSSGHEESDPDAAADAGIERDTVTGGEEPDGHGDAEAGNEGRRGDDGGSGTTHRVAGEQAEAAAVCGGEA
ncbi:hypothetical protein [Pseudonocardia adelaidensis]|uniref:hypothetical protein n=1 Tax=Pseudonocardia adelaidensis TaxID=648754 RepID=UPI0031E534A4